jgi:hypothetical protein
MRTRPKLVPPIVTPWGRAQTANYVADGITFYSTASHGGFKLSPERVALVAPEYRAYARRWSGSPAWYEEDVAALAVVATFPELFPEHDATAARAQLEQWAGSRGKSIARRGDGAD